MKNYYSVIIYEENNNFISNDIYDLFIEVYNLFEGKFYFRKSSINGKNTISFNGIDCYHQASCLKKCIEKLYIAKVTETEKSGTLNCQLTKDTRHDFFKNDFYFELYRRTSVKFDKCLNMYYFNDFISYKDIVNTLYEIYRKYDFNDNLSISHWSHFWGFFANLNSKQQKEIYKYLETNPVRLIKNNMLSDCFDVLLSEIDNLLQEDQNFNFYSPRNKEEIFNQKQFSSKLHKDTHKEAIPRDKELLRNKYLITNAWFLNILYEKLILCDISIFDKFKINYYIAKTHKKYDIDKSVCSLISNGKEKIIEKR